LFVLDIYTIFASDIVQFIATYWPEFCNCCDSASFLWSNNFEHYSSNHDLYCFNC